MATFLVGLASTVIEKLMDKAITDISSILGVKREMKRLKIKMEKIKNLLDAAKSKKIESQSIHFWLAEFREVLYDTEDLLDDFQVHEEAKATSKDSTGRDTSKDSTTIKKVAKKAKQKFSQVLSQTSKLMSDVNFKKNFATRIEDINETLDGLYSEATTVLGLENLPNKDHEKVCSYSGSRPTDTTSLQLDSDVVGIDDDATKLADQIITDTEQTHSAFAIIGMGGIGKSTLARKVFDLVKKEQHFDKSVWVNISRNWSGEYVLKEIVKSVKSYGKTSIGYEELCEDFSETVKDKSVFILLDDVWDKDVWERFLRVPLLKGAKYSRILITTRNEEVAKQMDVSKRHFMKRMLPKDGWLLLKKNVSIKEEDDALNDLLEETGKKIVERCEYLPLAIKAMAGVLKMKDKKKLAWEKVLKSETWSTGNLPEDVKASLLLSYEDLSPQLKQCFTYFSVLPRFSTSYVREIIVNLWIAEGFIEGKDVQESSEHCYDELMMRNLIQPLTQSESSKISLVNTHTLFVMHDLIYSLALFLSKKEHIYLQHSGSNIKRRHFCLYDKDLDAVPEEIMKQDYLRSLFLEGSYRLKTITSEVYVGHLRRLRVLDLLNTGIEKIPKEIGTLIHLKYLDLSYTEVTELPESIRNLKNLEVLRAWGLNNLHSLPSGITELINLKVFYVTWNVHSMPPGMDNIKNLRYLNNFPVSKDTSYTEGGSNSTTNIKELKGMSQLTYLVISNLERVSNKEEAEEAAIENKTNLTDLRLSWKYVYEDQEFDGKDIEKNENVFTGIKIPINLERLEISSFIGRKLPSHIFNANMLTVLELSRCLYVEQLPSLGDLPELERLTIYKAKSVIEIGREFFGSSKFPKLQFLEMWEMNNLEKMFEVEEGAFPCLQKLIVRECPKLKLKSLSEGWQHAKCLKFLLVERLENLESIENFNSVSELKLKSNSRLTSIKKFPSLKIITAFDCLSLREVKDVGELNQLFVSVEVKDVGEQSIAPEWVLDMSPPPKKIVLKKHSPRMGWWLTQDWSNSFDFRSKNL